MAENDADDPFDTAFATLAAPLARVMVGQGMTIAAATEALKGALLSAALLEAGPDATDSRIALLTGLHRKDVRRLRAAEPAAPKRSPLSAAATVLAIWAEDPAFCDAEQGPRLLPKKGQDAAPGFDDLVRAARIDLPQATVLAHLIGEGAVEETAGGLRLARRVVGLADAHSAKMESFGRNMAAHLETVADNLAGGRKFERALHVNQLSAASVAALEAEARTAAQALLEALNRRALALQDADAAAQTPADGRFVAGAFITSDPPQGADE